MLQEPRKNPQRERCGHWVYRLVGRSVFGALAGAAGNLAADPCATAPRLDAGHPILAVWVTLYDQPDGAGALLKSGRAGAAPELTVGAGGFGLGGGTNATEGGSGFGYGFGRGHTSTISHRWVSSSKNRQLFSPNAEISHARERRTDSEHASLVSPLGDMTGSLLWFVVAQAFLVRLRLLHCLVCLAFTARLGVGVGFEEIELGGGVFPWACGADALVH